MRFTVFTCIATVAVLFAQANELSYDGFAVWTADSMRRVTPMTMPVAEEMSAPSASMVLGRNERESVQVLLTCGSRRELADVTATLSSLVDGNGCALDGSWKWERVGYIPRMRKAKSHPFGPPADEAWMPDPLLPAAPFRVRPGRTQGLWLTVHAASGAKPGRYEGMVQLKSADKEIASVKVSVEVMDVALPKTFSTFNSYTLFDNYLRRLYPERFGKMRRAGIDILLDHRLSPDNISRTELLPIEELLHARDRGMNLFNILTIPYDTPLKPDGTEYKTVHEAYERHYPEFLASVKPYVEKLRRHGLDKLAYFYGFDEKEKEFYSSLDLYWRNLHRDVPGIPVMSTSRAYQDISKKVAGLTATAEAGDWFCPELCMWDSALTKRLHEKGKKVWWYVCCGPHHPYANFAGLEAPPIDGRILGWMTHLYGADGFLYWAVNYWEQPENAPLDEEDTYLAWDSSIDSNANGDGVLIYPGRRNLLPSIRLANIRDGVEDGELLKMAASRDAAEAERFCRRFIRATDDFTRDPQLIRASRRSVLRFLLSDEPVAGERSFAVSPGEEWRLDWAWRERDVPLTSLLRPHVTAYDGSGRVVYASNVGQVQQRTFGPEDMSVQRWRIYMRVADDRKKKDALPANYAVSIDKIELPDTTRRVTMRLVREGDAARVDKVELAPLRLETPPPPQRDGFPPIAENPRDMLTDAELDAILARRPKLVPKLVRNGDRTELLVNGKAVIPRIFKTAAFEVPNRLPSASAMSRKGFNIITAGLNFAPSTRADAQSSTGVWCADGSVDAEKVRLELRRYLKRCPDAMLMLVFIIQPPPGWGESNPGEILRSPDGRYGIVRGVYRVTDYRERLVYDWRKDEYPAFSYASEKFAADASAVLEKIFSELEKWPEGKAVIGTYLNGGTDTQWLDAFDNDLSGLQAADCSDVSRRRFSEWCARKYGRNTQTAIPGPDRFYDSAFGHYAEHAATTMGDWRAFYAEASAEMRLTMARAVKRASKGRMLVGSYSPHGGLAGYPLISQSCTSRLIASPDWDFFAVVPDYVREHTDPVMSAVFDGALVRNGKLFVSELDLRSHDVGNWGYWGSEFWRGHHTDATFRRKALFFAANALTHGGTYHAYDMDGGMYATSAAQETWRAVNAMAAMARPESPVAESIALVAGERYWDQQSLGCNRIVPYQMREMPRDALSRTGVHWSSHLVDDILSDKAAELPSVVYFADLTTVTHAQFSELRRRYAKDGRVLVYSYRPGLFAADGAECEKDLGLKSAPDGLAKMGFAEGDSSDPLMKGVKGAVVPVWSVWGFDHPRLSLPDVKAGWKTLATFEGTDIPALSVRRHDGFTEIYSSRPGGVTPALLRNCLREAGLNPLMETDELSGYGSRLFYFVAQSSGEKRFRLPLGRLPDAVLAGPAFREAGGGEYAVDMVRGDIFILSTRTELPSRGIGGHQGDYANYPDDTVSALKSAVRLGAHFVEFDIQRCKTGEFIVMHDHDLSRMTNLKGLIQDSTFDYIRSGHIVWRGKDWPDEKVPTLEEALACLPREGMLINLHCYGPPGNTVARDVALRVKELGRLDQCYIAAILPDIRVARAAVPELKTCNMTRPSGVNYYRPWTDEQNAEYLRTTIENRCQYLQLRQPWPRKFSDQAHAAGVKVNLCTCEQLCNDPKNLEHIFNELDIDYVLTENLGPMVEEYNRRIFPAQRKEPRK